MWIYIVMFYICNSMDTFLKQYCLYLRYFITKQRTNKWSKQSIVHTPNTLYFLASIILHYHFHSDIMTTENIFSCSGNLYAFFMNLCVCSQRDLKTQVYAACVLFHLTSLLCFLLTSLVYLLQFVISQISQNEAVTIIHECYKTGP